MLNYAQMLAMAIAMFCVPAVSFAGFLDYSDSSNQGSFYSYDGGGKQKIKAPSQKKKDEIPAEPGIHDSMENQIEAYRQRQAWMEAHRKKQRQQTLAEIKAEQEKARNLNSAYDKIEYLQEQLAKDKERRSKMARGGM